MIYIVLAIIFIFITVYVVGFLHNRYLLRRGAESIKKSLDIAGLPLISLFQDGKRYNFILDTGANNSVIDEDVIRSLKFTDTNQKSQVVGIEGTPIDTSIIEVELENNLLYNITFMVTDLTSLKEAFLEDGNIEVAGILGCDFMRKYEFLINFSNSIVYPQV